MRVEVVEPVWFLAGPSAPVLFATTDANGVAVFPFTVPNVPVLEHRAAWFQAVSGSALPIHATTLTGGVSVGSGATVGANAVVNPNLKIGKDAFVGSGAVVIRNVEGGEVVVGNPARVLDPRSQCAEGVD